jgi:hypothetical protein
MRLTALVVLLIGSGAASAADIHAYWENHCLECHGHAGAFARERLTVEGGVLVSEHWGSRLERFLANHRTTPATLGPIIAMLTAQVATPALYAEHCSGCHGTAADLVRDTVDRRDGVLHGRSSGRPLAPFLARHGGLASDEIPIVLESLDRLVDETVPR